MTSERITNIIGYSAETSGANEKPRWGHFTATWADEAQERFDRWLAEHDAALIENIGDEWMENVGSQLIAMGWLKEQAQARREQA